MSFPDPGWYIIQKSHTGDINLRTQKTFETEQDGAQWLRDQKLHVGKYFLVHVDQLSTYKVRLEQKVDREEIVT